MIRWTQPFSGGSVMFAIENPENTFMVKKMVNKSVPVTLTEDNVAYKLEKINAREQNVSINGGQNVFPDIIARVNLDPGFGHYSLVGMLRDLSIDTAEYDDSQLGYAFSANAVIPTFGKDSVTLEFNYGNAIGRYLNAGWDDGFLNPVTHEVETSDQYGFVVGYQHFWLDNLRSSVIYSMAERDNDMNYVTNTADDQYQSVHANLIWSPVPRINMGIEYIWAYREIENGEDGDLNRIQAGFQYKF